MKPLRVALAAAAAALACAAGAADAPARAPGAPQTLAAPHYGDTLFHFYQDHTFEALTGLMVSQHFGRIAPHDDEAEVLRGGMLLAYGLPREAGAVFARLIDGNAGPAVRDRAWYFLAQSQHRRGLDAQAEAALARVAAPLPGALEAERQLLRAQLLLARGDHAGAAAVLAPLQGSATAGMLARFNLGVALLRSGEVAQGEAVLDALGRAPAADEEQRALRDRANLALGYAALQAQRPADARASLQRVRLDGLQANRALLGYGWAAAALKDPQAALPPWTELAQRRDVDAAVLEARIALPYAWAEVGASGRALQGYRDALDGYAREQQALAESIAAIRAGRLVHDLVDRNPGSGLAAFASLRDLPAMPHAAHLAPLLATNEFQQGWRNLRDLQFLHGNLQQWQDSLGSFGDMLDNRRQAFAERLPAVRARAGALDLPALQQRRDAIAARVADPAPDPADHASAAESAQLQRLAQARARLATMADAPPDAAERLRRVAGALTWQLAQALPARAWEAKKALRATDAALAQARSRDAALVAAQAAEPERQQAFAQRIAALAQRLATLQPQVAQLAQEQQGRLQDLAVAELEGQAERLDGYAAQAQLAIAQLHDRAALAQRGGGEGVR